MAASIGPNLGLSYGWTPRNGDTPGDSGWGEAMSANLKKLDALFGLSVVSATATAPTVTANGTRYVVPATGATGAFLGKENQVAVRISGVWEFYVPARGMLAENQATGSVLKFDGTAWVDILAAVGSSGVNLLPDTYSWPTGAGAVPVVVSGWISAVGTAIAGSRSGFGYTITTADTSNGRFVVFAPTNDAAGWNLFLEPGTYTVSFWAAAAAAGVSVRASLYDGTNRYSPSVTLSTTMTRYSVAITVDAATRAALILYPNMAGVSGSVVTVDGLMVSRRPAAGASANPPPFVPGNSAAKVAALAVTAVLDVGNPGAGTLVNGAAFVKIPLYTANEDTRGGWSASAYTYTPPESGLYLVEAMLRPVRTGTNPMAANVNLKLGFGSAAADGLDVVADTSTDLLPFTLLFCKPMRLVAGTAYFIFGNHTSATPIAFTYAQLKITRLPG